MTRQPGGLSLRRLTALCRKESYQIVRDPSSILIAFVLPMVLLLIYGYGINLDSSRIRIGVVLEDDSLAGRKLAYAFAGSPYIEAVPGRTREEMSAALVAGKVRGFVVIQSDFAARLYRPGDSAPIQVITDGAEPNTANFVESYAKGAWQTWQQEREIDRGSPPTILIDILPRYWFNPSALSRNFLVPGAITIIMTVIGALLTSLVVAREWERGTMEALLSTPITRAELLLSKLIPYYILGMASMLVCVGGSTWVLHVPFRGSLAVLLLVTSLFLGSALGLGLLLSTVTRNQFNAAQGALNAAFLPATLLSGFLYEISSMPLPIRMVTYLVPARYFVASTQTLFQAGTIWPVILKDMAFLALSAAFFIGLTALKTRRSLD